MFWWYVFRGLKNHYYWCIIYYYKYKDRLSDGCSWIWGVVIYYLVIRTLQKSEISYDIRDGRLYHIWLCFSEFWHGNWRNNDMSYLSSKKSPQIIEIWLIYFSIARNFTENKILDPLVTRKILIWTIAVLPWTIWWLILLLLWKNWVEWCYLWRILQFKW